MASLLQSSVGLMRSRRSRQIVAWVFLSLLVIEAIVFIPSYQRRRQEQLNALEQLSQELLFAVKAGVMGNLAPAAVLDLLEAQLNPHSVVRGAALYQVDGTLLHSFGEPPELDLTDIGPDHVRKQIHREPARYDVAWPSSRFQGQYILAVRHDATRVGQELTRYALSIGGLVVIISLFVTLVTILVLERLRNGSYATFSPSALPTNSSKKPAKQSPLALKRNFKDFVQAIDKIEPKAGRITANLRPI